MRGKDSLITPPSTLLPIHTTKPRNTYADLHIRSISLSSTSSSRLPLARSADCANNLCISHLEVRTSVCGGLGPHLGCEAPEFVPSAAVEAEEGEGVG